MNAAGKPCWLGSDAVSRKARVRAISCLVTRRSPRLTWCEGETRTLILTCVKGATGDTSVNLHTLRHTHITAALAEVPLTVGGEYLADCISARHGHESARSTRESYDHGHELPLRTYLDGLDRSLPLSERAASHWLGVSRGALRKRWSRAKTEQDQFAWVELCAQRNRTDIPDVTSDFALAAPDRPEFVSLLDTPARFDAVRGVLIDATAGHPIQSIARRRDIAELLVSDVLLAGARAAGRRLSTSQLTGPLEILFEAVWSAASCVADFGRIGQPKLLPLAGYLETAAPTELVVRATSAWCVCLRREYISLEQPKLLLPFLEMLKAADFPIADLVVRFAPQIERRRTRQRF